MKKIKTYKLFETLSDENDFLDNIRKFLKNEINNIDSTLMIDDTDYISNEEYYVIFEISLSSDLSRAASELSEIDKMLKSHKLNGLITYNNLTELEIKIENLEHFRKIFKAKEFNL